MKNKNITKIILFITITIFLIATATAAHNTQNNTTPTQIQKTQNTTTIQKDTTYKTNTKT